MGRSKFNRKPSTGSVPVNNSFQRKNSASTAAQPPGLIGSGTREDTLEAINYHFDHLTTNLKSFLLTDPNALNVKKFFDFWSSPENIDSTSSSVAASLCGCSWYLALNYLSIGMIAEARALTLNGCFLQQVYNTPIEEIADQCSDTTNNVFLNNLPYYNDGLVAISTQQRLATFLKNRVTADYQRRMAFATRTTKTKAQVQDYCDQISCDWNETPAASKAKQFRKRASTGMNVGGDEKYIDIVFIDAHTKKEKSMRHGTSMPLKLLVKKFAEDENLPLKKLRFSYKGKNLFLSSLGQKSPKDLGISHLDSIFVHNKDASDDEATSSSSDESSKENHSQAAVVTPSLKKFKPFSRKNSHTPCVYVSSQEQDRRNHSRKLSAIFEEAEAKFKEIRQKLNDLTIDCQPKAKSRPQRVEVLPSFAKPIDNPCTIGQGGKAGVPVYVVHVGETDNLYKTRHTAFGKQRHTLSVDLHGYTKEQAVEELDSKLPEWVNTAQRGQYPFVIPVTIICGCGNQILSEAVEEWIKGNDQVANAPKKKFNRMQTY